MTTEEIAGITVFAGLSEADRERLSRAAADITLAAGEYAAYEGGERALFGVLEGRIEAVKLVDGIGRVVGERAPGDIFGEVPITLGTMFPVGFRAAEAVARYAPRPRRLLRRRRRRAGRRQARSASWRAIASAAGAAFRASRAEPSAAAGVRGRAALGSRLHRAAPLPRPQPDHVQVAPARIAPDAAEQWDGPLPADGGLPGAPRRRRQDGRAAAAAPRRRAARPRHRAGGRGVRHGDRRCRPGRPGGGRVRRIGGPAHDRDRARGAGRPGRHLVADRELPRLPLGRLGRRARQPCAAAGPPARRRDPRHPGDHADRRRHPAGAPRRRRRPAGADDHPRLRRHLAPARRSRAATGSPGRASPTARPAARRRASHGLDVQIVGAGNSAGQAALFFSTHARR